MENFEIKKAGQGDTDQLKKIGIQTFSETFSDGNSKANIQKYLESAFAEERVKSELKDPNSEIYFVLTGNRVIGYLKLNSGPSQTELQDENSLEIERIYVLKEYQGQQVGKLLYQKAIEIARQKNVDYVWLGVWENNAKAIKFYSKNGFAEFDKHVFRLGDDEQTDIMMKLQIK